MRVERARLVGRRLGQDDDREREPGEQDEHDDSVAEQPPALRGSAPRRERRREVSEEQERGRAERKGTQARARAAPEREARGHRDPRVLGRLLEVPEDGTERPRVVGGASDAARQAIRVQRVERRGSAGIPSAPGSASGSPGRAGASRAHTGSCRGNSSSRAGGRARRRRPSELGEYASRSSKTTWYMVAARSVCGTCRAYQTPKTQSPTASHAAGLLQAPASASRTPARRAPKTARTAEEGASWGFEPTNRSAAPKYAGRSAPSSRPRRIASAAAAAVSSRKRSDAVWL